MIILFGTPGVGKSFVGKILAHDYGYYFYDADVDLTPEMIKAVKTQTLYTDEMRDHYFAIVIKKMAALKLQQPKLVMAQALAKEKNRQQILTQFPEATFMLIEATEANIEKRIRSRVDWISIDYAKKIRNIFEKPQLKHFVLDNNEDESHIKQQLEQLD